MENKRDYQQPKPTKEQLKKAMKKIMDYHKTQKESKDNNNSGTTEENTTFQQ